MKCSDCACDLMNIMNKGIFESIFPLEVYFYYLFRTVVRVSGDESESFVVLESDYLKEIFGFLVNCFHFLWSWFRDWFDAFVWILVTH